MYAFSTPCAASGSPRCLAHEHVPTGIFSSNPFDFKQFRTLLRSGVSPTPFPSITSTLFPHGGQRIPHAHSLGARHRKSCVCHTSEKSPANSFIYHTSKNSLPQVPCLPHLRHPPGGLCTSSSQFGTSSIAQSQGKLCCLYSATSHQSRITSHPSSHCMHSRAVPQLPRTLAMCGSSTGKHLRIFRCLNKESGQCSACARRRARQAVDPKWGCRET